MGRNITSGQNFDLEQNATCLNSTAVDLYYMPDTANTLYGGLHQTPTQYHPQQFSPLLCRPNLCRHEGNKDNGKETSASTTSTTSPNNARALQGKRRCCSSLTPLSTCGSGTVDKRVNDFNRPEGSSYHRSEHNFTTTPLPLPPFHRPSPFLSSMPYGNVAQDPCHI